MHINMRSQPIHRHTTLHLVGLRQTSAQKKMHVFFALFDFFTPIVKVDQAF